MGVPRRRLDDARGGARNLKIRAVARAPRALLHRIGLDRGSQGGGGLTRRSESFPQARCQRGPVRHKLPPTVHRVCLQSSEDVAMGTTLVADDNQAFHVDIRHVSVVRPFIWLARGWSDLKRHWG